MEEMICSLVIQGCKLARDLESNLPNLANQPNVLSNSCDEIIHIFSCIKQHLIEVDVDVQQWLRSNASATDMVDRFLVQTRAVTENSMFDDMHGTGNVETSSARSRGNGGDHEIQGRSSSQRPRRPRNNNTDRRIVRVRAIRNGDTCTPPDDNFTWRKYGQKEILGSTFPRSYYRCTHQKTYQCPAKKLAQLLDDDPDTYEITYRSDHTCILSSTVPAGAPAPPPPTTTDYSEGLSTWLPMEFKPYETGTRRPIIMDSQIELYQGFDQSGRMVGSSSVGPSTVRFDRHVDYQLAVVDMADVMFNSGSTSGNSMDFLFPSNVQDK